MVSSSNNVAALFVRRDSVYKELGVDCYDIDRDARSFTGGKAVICHPPCRAWGRLKHLAKPRTDEKALALTAVDLVRAHGGVLEHPSGSSLWRDLSLPLGDSIDQFGGFTLSINQSWFGHLAQKRTLLYIVGCKPRDIPQMPFSLDAPLFALNPKNKFLKELPRKMREETPIALATWLIDLANICYTNCK